MAPQRLSRAASPHRDKVERLRLATERLGAFEHLPTVACTGMAVPLHDSVTA